MRRALLSVITCSYFSYPHINPSSLRFYLRQSSLNMPPKRKPVQKETEVIEQTSAETALKSVENNEDMDGKDEEVVDNPVEEVPSKPAKKAPGKKQKNKPINNPEAPKDTPEENEVIDTPVESANKDTNKENVKGLNAGDEPLKTTEKVTGRRGGKRAGHKADDDASSNPALKDSSEDIESTAGVSEEVGVNQTDKEPPKKMEVVSSRRGAKRGAHKTDDVPHSDDNVEKVGETRNPDIEENPSIEAEAPKKKRGGKKNGKEASKEDLGDSENKGSSIDAEQKHEPEVLPKKREGKKHVEVPDQDAEPVSLRRGGRRNVQAAKVAPKAEHGDDASNGSGELVPEEKAGKKRGGKGKEDKKNASEPEEKKSKLEEVSYDCEKENKKGEKWNLKVSTWNVAGMRAWIKKNGVDYIKEEDADIVCLQETKCPESKVPPEAKVEGYHVFWANSAKDGYAGVALYSKEKPIKVSYGINNEEYDDEGRAITAEFEKFYLVTTYVPNAGQGLKTLPKRMGWDDIFRNYLKELDAKKPVILCGDMNVAHEEIDLANPKTNTKHAGFTKEEREKMTELLKEGFVDSFRQLYPGKTGCYTFWTFMGNARSRNTGWRLDYFIVSERLMDSVCDVAIRNKVLGSDHCPVTLFIHV